MFGLTGIKLGGIIAGVLAILGFIGWIVRIDSLRAEYKTELATARGQEATVLTSIRAASDNPKLGWSHAAEQVDMLATANLRLKLDVGVQTDKVIAQGVEAARQKGISAANNVKADAAIAKREAVITRLETIAMTPGDRANCAAQLNDAENALDLVYASGV